MSLEKKYKKYCGASGQFLGYGSPEKIGEIHLCELCGRPLKITSHFGDVGFPKWPLHKLPKSVVDFSVMQLQCSKALMSLPNNMGSAKSIASAIGNNVQQVSVTSAMMALIRKDNIKPYEQSKWVVRLPPKDRHGVAWYCLTEEFKIWLGKKHGD